MLGKQGPGKIVHTTCLMITSMSIADIKELFCKRVQESVAFKSDEPLEKKVVEENSDEENQFLSLKEGDVGITEYLNDCQGFSAVIKQRFSDFHVHEIDLDGNVVYLNSTEIPVVKTEEVSEEVLPKEIWEKLKNLDDKTEDPVEVDVTNLTKQERKDIHKVIKSKYKTLFNSNTVQQNDKKILIVSRGKGSKRCNDWFGDLGKNLHFVLFKKNLDTVDAINIIASQLKTKSSNLTYAGTKDKRANTSQWVSMWHLDAKKLNGINNNLRDIRVGNFVYKNTQLKLGDLKGNLFEIVLRNVTENNNIIDAALNTVKEKGFINYFGLQRFGNSFEVPTYEVGKALVKGDFKMAVELILKPRKGKMRDDLREARKVWWETRNADKAFKCLKSKDRTIEGKLLLGLAKHGKNAYVNALDCIPRNVRLLYLHSYQSYLWNKILSKRIKEFGKTIIEGDLISLKNNSNFEVDDVAIENLQDECIEKEGENELSKASNESNDPNKEVRHLSQEELNKFTIYDIVHPLPGYSVIYPNNIVKKWYEDLLSEDGLTSEKLKQTVRQYSLSGTYRHIVKNVNDLLWYKCSYSDPEEDLILSDLDKLNGCSLKVNENLNGEYKAVVLKFSLDSSTYATMVLREILKIDTSCSYQATLNNYCKRPLNGVESEESRKKSKM